MSAIAVPTHIEKSSMHNHLFAHPACKIFFPWGHIVPFGRQIALLPATERVKGFGTAFAGVVWSGLA